jgi:uncharacterized protein (DUF2384 family)
MQPETAPDFKASIQIEIDYLRERVAILERIQGMDVNLFGNVVMKTKQVWYEEDIVWKWLCRPLLRLGNKSPLEAVADGESSKVHEILNGIIHGIYR